MTAKPDNLDPGALVSGGARGYDPGFPRWRARGSADMNRKVIDVDAPGLDTTPEAAVPRVPGDQPCVNCGYNLRTLPVAARCPECDTPVSRSLVRELGGRLAGLTLRQQVFALATWPLFEQLIHFSVSFAGLAVAGHLGRGAAVPVTNGTAVGAYVEWLINLMQAAIGVGSTALIARAIGGRHRRLANGALGQSLILAVAVGLFMGALVFTLAPVLASFPGLTGDSLHYCITYLRVISLAAPFSAIAAVSAACLRGSGDTLTPFRVLVVVAVVNVVSTITLVYAPAPWGGHGIVGIALGPVIAYTLGAGMLVRALLRGNGVIRLYPHRLRPHLHTMLRILRIGLPNLLEMFFALWVANFIIMRIVGASGNAAAWGAHQVAVRAEAISYMPGFALGIAAATLAGQYLGCNNPQRAREAVIACWKVGLAIMGVMGVVLVLFPEWPVRLATDDPDLLALSPELLRIAGCVQLFFATAIVFGQGMRGAGDTRTTMLLTACSTYGVRLPLAYLFGVTLHWGLRGVWLALCAELTFRGCLFAARFFHGGWIKAKV